MAYTFKYRLQSAPQGRLDGSGMLDHDTWAIASEDGGDWQLVPGRHKTVCVPAEEIAAALSEPTTPERVAAYKQALADNLETVPVAVEGWAIPQLAALMEANDLAAATASAADDFIVSVAGGYPVDFSA